MRVELLAQPFDPWAELSDEPAGSRLAAGRYGATAVFVGTMRDFNAGDSVRSMFLEHYPGMTDRELERIAQAAQERWQLLDVWVLHRVGEVAPGDPIVLVAVWSAHRGAAFDACREIMEVLKSQAPFWKKEVLEHGARWVEHNTNGY